MWFHIEYYFKTTKYNKRGIAYLGPRQLIEFKKYINKIVKAYSPALKRRFFLFEPKPHCFLALEINGNNLNKIDQKVLNITPPKFVHGFVHNYNSHDETNGEVFLDFMNGAYDLIMIKDKKFCPSWLKKHPKDWQVLTHSVHCLLNSFTNSRVKENMFYNLMDKTYTSPIKYKIINKNSK